MSNLILSKKTGSISFILIVCLIMSMIYILPDTENVYSAGNTGTKRDVSSFDQLKTAVSDAAIGDTINIIDDIEFEEAINITTSMSITGQGKIATKLLITGGAFNKPGKGYRHFMISNDGLSVSMSDLTIEGPGYLYNGIVTGGAADTRYGGVEIPSSDFESDLYCDNILFTLNVNNYTQGSSLAYGGGLANRSKGMTELSHCEATYNMGAYGGGLYANNLKATNCVISNNHVNPNGQSGGGVYAMNATISDCIIEDNIALNGGAGIYAFNKGTISNCLVKGNISRQGGGGISANNIKLNNCLIVHNESTNSYGGGVSGRPSEITNCTITGNRAQDGGGVYGTSTTIIGSSIVSNAAVELGNEILTTSRASIAFSIIGNGNSNKNVISNYDSVIKSYDDWKTQIPAKYKAMDEVGSNIEYSVIGSPEGYTLTDLFGEAGPVLSDNGGDTLTFLPTAKAKVIPVNAVTGKLPITDQRGIKRSLFGTSCMGSVEINPQYVDDSNPNPNPNSDTTKSNAANVTKIHSPYKTIYVKKGKSFTIQTKAYATDSPNPKLSWTTNKKNIATVSSNGKVKAKKTGTVKITAKADNGQRRTFKVIVIKKDKKIKKISVTGNKKTIGMGKSQYLNVKLNPKSASSKKVTFKSNKPETLWVDKVGKITGKKKGTAKVTVKVGSKKKVIKVKVK